MPALRTVKFPRHPVQAGDEPEVVFFDQCAIGVVGTEDTIFLDMFEKQGGYVFEKLGLDADEARKLAALLMTAVNRQEDQQGKKGGTNVH